MSNRKDTTVSLLIISTVNLNKIVIGNGKWMILQFLNQKLLQEMFHNLLKLFVNTHRDMNYHVFKAKYTIHIFQCLKM